MPPTPHQPVDPDVLASDRVRSPHPRLPDVLRERWDVLLVISAGGALGSLARWGLGELLPHGPGDFAWSTFVANVTGALLLGVLMAFMVDLLASTRYVRPFLGVGLMGGYTTFSTYLLDTQHLLTSGRPWLAPAYVGGTLLVGLAAVWAGLVTGRALIALAHRGAARRNAHDLSDRAGDPGRPTTAETRNES